MATNGKLYIGCWMAEEVVIQVNKKCDTEGLKSQGEGARVAICKWLGIPLEKGMPPKVAKASKSAKKEASTETPPKAPPAAAPKPVAGKETTKKPPVASPKAPAKATDLSDLEDLEDDDDDDETDEEDEAPRVPAKSPTPRRDAAPAAIAETRKAVHDGKAPAKTRRPMPGDGLIGRS